MKQILVLLLATAALNADGITYLKLGKPHRLLGDKVRVRAEAGPKGKILAELAVGSEITPTEQTTALMTQDGVEAPWYKVSFMREGKKTEGFIWGNLIAKGYASGKSGWIFLYGIGRGVKSDPTWTNYSTQVRVAKDGKELAKLEIKEGVGFMSGEEVELKDGTGFSGIQNIFVVRFLQEYCGGKGNRIFIFWNGEKLFFAHSSSEGFDAPAYAREEQVFPADKGGKKEYLYLVNEQGDSDDPKSKKITKSWLKWTGSKFEKIP